MPHTFNYVVYGVQLGSDIPLDLPAGQHEERPTIKVSLGIPQHQENRPGVVLTEANEWCQYVLRDDESIYAIWEGLGCFVVSPCGSRIWAQPHLDVSKESFQVYLLGQALSFALIRCGFEPIHGTAVAHAGQAVAFLGNSGFGKSTLAASFLRAGFRLVTDDLLVLTPEGSRICAQPGPPRIKLVPGPVSAHFNCLVRSVPMNSWSEKYVIPIDQAQQVQEPVELVAMYVLGPPAEQSEPEEVSITEINGIEAFAALAANTFNTLVTDTTRLKQLLHLNIAALQVLSVKRLTYPRRLESLVDVHRAIVADSGVGTPLLT